MPVSKPQGKYLQSIFYAKAEGKQVWRSNMRWNYKYMVTCVQKLTSGAGSRDKAWTCFFNGTTILNFDTRKFESF